MKSTPVIRRLLACAALLAARPAAAQSGPKPSPATGGGDGAARPALRELWVPAEDLAPVLRRYPRAVPLSRDQLLSLLRDAHADGTPTTPENPPPVAAVVRRATFEGSLATGLAGQTQVRVDARLEVEALSDTLAEVPLGLEGIALGTAEIDDDPGAAGLRRRGDGPERPASLVVQGRGVHALHVGFLLPTRTGPEGTSVALPTVAGVGEFALHLPAGTRAESPGGCAVEPDGAGLVARVALRLLPAPPAVSPTAIRDFAKPGGRPPRNPPAAEPARLSWRNAPPSPAETGAVLQFGRTEATVDETGVNVRQEIVLRPAFGRLPAGARFALPAGAGAVRVEGSSLGRWDLGADGLRLELTGRSSADEAAAFTVFYRLGLDADEKGRAQLDLAVLAAAGAHRVASEITVRRGHGVTVQRIVPGAAVVPAASPTSPPADEAAPDFVAGFALADLPRVADGAPLAALRIETRRTATRFSVDADVRADFQPDGVRLTRTLAFQVEEGELFVARVGLPPGETVLSLHAAGPGAPPDWRQEGGELRLNWTGGLAESSKTAVTVETQAELAAPKAGAPTNFSLAAALVPGAERLTGYIALASAPAFRVATLGGEERLERRDSHATPVRGDVAWFYRDDFRLALRVERRAAETEARFTGYALPQAGAVEVHAQIDYRFLYSGAEAVKIRVPRESADAFFFTGAHIAERRRDDDVWTIRFQGEQSGDYALGVQATLPAPADRNDAQHFHFRLPAVVPLECAHWSGTWAVEANTDTEIRFAATGANEVDTLHAPPLAGYQPRRRVIGVFEFLGGATDAAVDLDGVRHAPAGGAAAVVDRLDLETDAATSGVMRHRATVRARTVGDGFFDLRLPAGAALWSLTLDGEPVKPVGSADAPGEVRVELPGGRTPQNASTVVVVYETPGRPWDGAGWRVVAAPRFDDGVPVFQSHWTLRVPDGFEYRFAGASSPTGRPDPTTGSLLIPRMARALGHLAQWAYYHPWTGGAADKASLPPWIATQFEKRKRSGADGSPEVAAPDLADKLTLSDEAAVPAAAEVSRQPAFAATPTPNATPGPVTIAPVAKVKNFLLEAQQFYDAGRYDLAFKRYEQALALDPYNDAARRGEERVVLAKARHGEPPGYPETRGQLNAQATKEWEPPVRRSAEAVNDDTGTVAITRKLQSIVIPNVEFRQTTLNDAVEFLRQESRRLDPDPDESNRGINIFLKLPVRPANVPGTGIPGLPPSSELTPTPSAPVVTGATRISLTLSHLPLYNALDYLGRAANLKLKVEPYAVSLVPLSEETGDLITLEIRVPPSFLGTTSGGGTSATGSTDVTGVGGVSVTREDAKSFLESSGVTFPPGSSAAYLPSTGKLVVRNTQANLDLVAALAAESGGSHAPAPPPVLDKRASVQGVPGLLPIRLDLPENGVAYVFDGGGEPGALDFHYADWAVAARWRWVWLTIGALGFLLGAAGWAHPWRRTLGAVLALTFFPLIVAPPAAVPCNALLAGWLWAVLGWGVTGFLLRRQRLAATLALAGVSTALAFSHAQAAPTPSPELVIVPYDATKPVAGQAPAQCYLPYERFLALWDAAKHHRRPPAPDALEGGERFTLGAGRYDARLVGDNLEIDAALDLQTFGEGWVGVPLPFDPSRVGTVLLDGAPAALGGDGVLWIGTPGGHHARVTLRLPAPAVAAGTRLAWPVPPTAATLVTFLLPRTDLRAELHGRTPDTGEVEEIVPEGRRLTASLGGTPAVELTFRDAPPPAPAAGQPALAEVNARLTVGGRQESVAAEIRFSFPGNAQGHFTVLLDRSLTLTGLDAAEVRQWRLTTGGDRQTLEVDLDTPARDAYRLLLTADRPTEPVPAARRTFPLVSAAATRVEPTAALLTEGAVELALPDGPGRGLRRVDAPASAREHLFAAFAGDGPPVVYSVRGAAEQRAAHIDYLYQVGHGKIELAASLRLAPAPGGAPLTTADLRLPAGFTVQAVVGAAVRQWWRDGDVLSLRFRPEAGQAGVSVLVYLVQPLDRDPGRVALPPVVALGFASTDGGAVVAADRSLEVGLTLPPGVRADALAEINAATAAHEFRLKAPLQRQRAFRYRGAGFDAVATLTSQPARWQAQWVTQATVRDGAVALETHVNAAMLQGATDTLEFSLPAGLNEARVSGPAVRETVVSGGPGERRGYRVLFQNALYPGAEAAFTISLELPLDANNRAALPDLALPGEAGRRAGGFVLVQNASSGEMNLDPHALEPAVENDVPFLPPSIVAGTRFFRAPPDTAWSLAVRVTNLEKTAGRAALVAYAELTSTLRADGEEWHRATYRLQNRRLQFLPVELPAGTELVSARVAGESVRVDAAPAGGDAAPGLLVPLVKTRPGELSYDVELVYRRPGPGSGARRAVGFFGHWQLEDPRLPGVPVEKTLWDVYLPSDTRLLNVGGNLEPVVAALSTTEKLESALSDLRDLSATYRSGTASRTERQRALSNYNALAAQVTAQAQPQRTLRGATDLSVVGALFKKPNAVSQNALVNRSQLEILSTVDSLNTANLAVNQKESGSPPALRTASEGNAFDGFIHYDSPLSQDADSTAVIGAPVWRDNRINTAQSQDNATVATASAPRADASVGGELFALNDAVAVDLPKKEARAAGGGKATLSPQFASSKDTASGNESPHSLSTARATLRTDAPGAPPASQTEVARRQSPQAAAPPTVPALGPEPVATPTPPTQTLRSEGHISLAVDFPLEGQVYHFKKIKADARLTLWSVQPARFVRLAWFALLLACVGIDWMVRRTVRRRRQRRAEARATSPKPGVVPII